MAASSNAFSNGSVHLEEIADRISAGESMESVMERLDWKGFEAAIASVFEANDFRVSRNFRFKIGRRYEIDLVCSRNGRTVLVDCKRWCGGRCKVSALKDAVSAQKTRAEEFAKLMRSDGSARKKLCISTDSAAQPLIVTMMEEAIIESGGCFIVPAWKLNGFLLDI